MKNSYLLGVDLGTTATKAALYRLDGSMVSEGRAEVPLHCHKPGFVEQNSEDFYSSAACAIRECLSLCSVAPETVAGLAFDSQMAGVGTIDEDFLPATRFDSWLDMRCRPYIEQLDRDHGDTITRLTGCPPTCDHGPKILWWMHERPKDYQRIAKFVMPSCYVAGRAAGLKAGDAFIDYTFLHFTALSDARRGSWSDDLCALMGVDPSRLPRIVAPWEVIGELRPEAAKDFGLVPGIPLAAGAGDTAAGALGAGVVNPGMLLDTAGTASVLACCTDRFVADRENRALLTMRSVVPGVWNPLAYVGGGGLTLPWFRDKVLGIGGRREPSSDEDFNQLFDLASTAPPGCDGLLFCPHLGGRICPAAPNMRGAWVGFSWGHEKKHFFRAIVESVGYEYVYYLRILRELLSDLRLEEARVIGGGAKSGFWNQMKADILQVPFRRVLRAESATWGCALIAAKAAGLISDIAQKALETSLVSEKALDPNPEFREVYRRCADDYISWQRRLKEGFEQNV
jgi:xylulokinase